LEYRPLFVFLASSYPRWNAFWFQIESCFFLRDRFQIAPSFVSRVPCLVFCVRSKWSLYSFRSSVVLLFFFHIYRDYILALSRLYFLGNLTGLKRLVILSHFQLFQRQWSYHKVSPISTKHRA